MSNQVVAAERRQTILNLLEHQGFASMAEVMEVTSASEATVRRDLAMLENTGSLERTRGGAKAIARRSSLDERFEIRRGRDRREKRTIGRLAAERIPDGATVFMNDGSSTYAVGQWLAHRPLTVITSGLNIAEYLSGFPELHVLVIGGSLRGKSFGTDGPMALDAISTLHADIAVIGVDGVTMDGGARSNSLEDAAVARTMCRHADRSIILASPSKIGREARVQTLPWSEVNELVATTLPPEFSNFLGSEDVQVSLPIGGQLETEPDDEAD